METDRSIAYFSMEIGLEAGMPTYNGGLGILAGDTVRAAADFSIPIVAVTLLHRKGYFYQRLDDSGGQHEEPAAWVIDDFVQALLARTSVTIEEHPVHLRAWQYTVCGIGGYTVPVYFLNADLPENTAWDHTLTDVLYGDEAY
jgi:starch phosphorylase